MATVDLFTVANLFLRVFAFLGLVQVRFGPGRTLEHIKISPFIIPIVLFVYWINAVVIFYYEKPSTDTISIFSNITQMIINGIMLSVILIYPVKLRNVAKKILSQLLEIHGDLERVRIHLDYPKVRRNFLIISGSFFAFLIYYVAFDAYSYFKAGTMSVKYWFVTILPSVFMILVLIQPICVLSLIRSCYKRVNKSIVSQLASPTDNKEELIKNPMSITNIMADQNKSGKYFVTIIHILRSLNEICQKIEHYFGALFLSTFTTIFIVTSIQLYYCYQILVQKQDEKRGLSYMTLVACLNVVVINSCFIISITALCQSISDQSKKSNRFMHKLQLMGSKTMSAKEIQALVQGTTFLPAEVNFTAWNFFNLDYSMLCGVRFYWF